MTAGRHTSRVGHGLLAAALLLTAPAVAQGFGPRALQLVPENSTAVTAHGLFLDGNQSLEPGSVVEGSDVHVDLAVLQLTRAFRLPGLDDANGHDCGRGTGHRGASVAVRRLRPAGAAAAAGRQRRFPPTASGAAQPCSLATRASS